MSNVFSNAGTGFINALLNIFTSREYRDNLRSLVADGIEYRILSGAEVSNDSTTVIVSFPTDESIRSEVVLAVEQLNHDSVTVHSFTRGGADA